MSHEERNTMIAKLRTLIAAAARTGKVWDYWTARDEAASYLAETHPNLGEMLRHNLAKRAGQAEFYETCPFD